MLHNVFLPATTSARATLFDATSHPRPRTSHELLTPCSSPLQRQHSLDCLLACLTACLCRQSDGAIRALRTSRPPSAYSARGTPLGTSRPSGRTSWSVGACLPQYAEAVPPAVTRIGEDTLLRLASVLERQSQLDVARVRFS